MIDFLVIGLPRSSTTWIANWLTTDRSLCLHDPFAYGLPEQWPRDARRFGISCTGAYLFPKWIASLDCPIAVIERNPDDCDTSLARMGWGDTSGCLNAFKAAPGRRFNWTSLWNEAEAAELWAYLMPDVTFDAIRYRLLTDIQVQPHMGKWLWSPKIFHEMQRRENESCLSV